MSMQEERDRLSVDELDLCDIPFTATRDDLAPEFTAQALINNQLSEVNLGNERGKWVILFFYSSNFTFV